MQKKSGEWICLSCKHFNPADKIQWQKKPCNTCRGTKESDGSNWEPKK